MRVELLGGAYQSRSLIAAAQRSINLYPEINPPEGQPPVPVTHYLTPGLRKVSQAPLVEKMRALYRATNGDLYAVVGQAVYYITDTYIWTSLGTITAGQNPVVFADNGLCIVIVDGTSTGYAIDMTSRAFGTITDPNFFGATGASYLDTYFIFNKPGTANFYISLSNVTYSMLTGTAGSIYAVTLSAGGSGYTNGTFTGVALTGGTGSGATANLTISGGVVTAATINAGGTGYTNGDVLQTSSSTIGSGGILTGSITTAGSAYTNGTYTNVSLTGGAGTGAKATIVVSGGSVTSVTITTKGTGYVAGNSLSAAAASIGGTGSGFAWTAATVAGGLVIDVANVHGSAFDPLDIAGKTGSGDNIVTLASIHGQLWLIGELTSEIWADVGQTDFAFQRIAGAFIDHGCAAAYSLAQQDISLFWLTQDRQGEGVVVKTEGYSVKRISTHAIEADIQSYARIDDAIGYCHQIQGHAFYVLTFPTAKKTWGYEVATGQWHERASLDANGGLGRHRGNAFAFAYGKEFVGDYQNGQLYVFDQAYFYDGTVPIPRIRTFPHMIKNGQRVEYTSFIVDMEVGQPGDDPAPVVSLRWSDDRGETYGNPLAKTAGPPGKYLTQIKWNKLGFARDRVFEVSWSFANNTSLNGAFVETRDMAT